VSWGRGYLHPLVVEKVFFKNRKGEGDYWKKDIFSRAGGGGKKKVCSIRGWWERERRELDPL